MLASMKRSLCTLAFSLPLLASCATTPDYGRALPAGAPALIPLDEDEEIPDFSEDWYERDDLIEALDRSIEWTRRPHAERFFPQAGISHELALASLERFRDLLTTAASADAFQRAVAREFQVYRSAGWDGRGGGVLFTAYCTPILDGSLEPDAMHAHPLYALPSDLVKDADGTTLGWETAVGRMPRYPARRAIEAGGILEGKGLELAWLADPIDAYIAHVNGSAFIRLTDGSMFKLGYAGKNGRAYRSLGRALEADGLIPEGTASLQTIREWAASASPDEVDEYLSRNESYVFFTPIDGNPHGSLDVEVTGGRSIATDKTVFPRGAVTFVASDPEKPNEPFVQAYCDRFYLDQDTGGAIRTAGRADLYLGIGDEAEQIAGRTKVEGQLYYLFLRR